ncbi:membrane hypothetical protein [Candidatus Sulfopaludibacter sp. SbA3]|nr:membrane hypothetical protein [Candidatus Sulfopaludibacter sp. SbA3]
MPAGRRALRVFPGTIGHLHLFRARYALAVLAALLAPLVLLSFHPVDEIDSINYLHYLIEWMANRSTPYDFATYYVAFWELSFLPTWMVTRVDLFFPLLELKSLVLLALAAWLLGREFKLRAALLGATVLGSCLLRHMWYAVSGISTLKNDMLHGVGFLLLTLVVVRATRRRLTRADIALLAGGVIFAPVKYLGIFIVPVAIAAILWFRREQVRSHPASTIRATLAIGVLALGTSWHYYVHHVLEFGSPFYPVQINLGPIHLPGLADLSNTSLLYNARNPELWRIFFLPASGISHAGLMFPLVLALTLLLSAGCCARAMFLWLRHGRAPAPLDAAAFLILCGWMLYFRSALGAGGAAGDLGFIRNDLNSLRYAEGVLAASELFLVALFQRIAPALVGANLASRLILLYSRIPAQVFPLSLVLPAAGAVLVTLLAASRLRPRLRAALCLAALVISCPFLVERNRVLWTPYWNDLKPALSAVRTQGLAVLALTDGGYFAGQVVAAGNPVNPAVRALLPEQMDQLPVTERPAYLAVLFSPGSEGAATWRIRYAPYYARWGYSLVRGGEQGLLLRRSQIH